MPKMVSGSVIDWRGQITGQSEVCHLLHLILLISRCLSVSFTWMLLGVEGKRKISAALVRAYGEGVRL